MEKCYKIHGFPPGYKFNRGKNEPPSANQVFDCDTPQLPITYKRCQQLINMFKPSISEYDSYVNQVSMQGENMTTTGDSSLTNGMQLYDLDSKHFVFASSLSLTPQPSLINSTKTSWIIDTGATNHMICSKLFFSSITSTVSKSVRLPNGQYALVTHIGTIKISDSFILTDVLCIPSFSFNLIYVSKLIKNLQYYVIFLLKFCFVQHLKSWKIIGVGKEAGGLYHLLQNPVFVLPKNSVYVNFAKFMSNNDVTVLASDSFSVNFVNNSL